MTCVIIAKGKVMYTVDYLKEKKLCVLYYLCKMWPENTLT